MELINHPLYQALKEAGVSDEHALQAASTTDDNLRNLLAKLQDTLQQLAINQALMQGDIRQLRWMLGAVLALLLVLLGRVFFS